MGSTAKLTPQYVSPVKVFGEVLQRIKSSDIQASVFVGHIGASGTSEFKDFTVGGVVTGLANSYSGTIAKIYSPDILRRVIKQTGAYEPAIK